MYLFKSLPTRKYVVFILGAGGVLLLAWFAWQNVGTNLISAPKQKAEINQLEHTWQTSRITKTPQLKNLQPFAVIRIPAIGLVAPIVQGDDAAALKLGVGHYPQTPLPGQLGNVGLAGHRTTYGKPFWNLQELHTGDVIRIQTSWGTFSYHVVSTETVSPDDWSVVRQDTSIREITLTTCTPRFTALQRYVIHAVM